MKINNNSLVAAVRDVYWVEFYDEAANLHCTPYLTIDDDIVLIDPGTIPHLLAHKLRQMSRKI